MKNFLYPNFKFEIEQNDFLLNNPLVIIDQAKLKFRNSMNLQGFSKCEFKFVANNHERTSLKLNIKS